MIAENLDLFRYRFLCFVNHKNRYNSSLALIQVCMQKKCIITNAAMVFLIAGCSSSSGILPAGPDTYTVTERLVPMLGGGTEAKRIALGEANAFCEQHGRKFYSLNMEEGGSTTQWGGTGYSVTFRCFLPSDPRLKDILYGQIPNPDTTGKLSKP